MLKKVAIVVVIVGMLGLYVGFHAWRDYAWAGRQIVAAQEEGWVVLKKFRSGDIALPWTLVRAPVTRIVFVEPSISSIDTDDDGLIVVGTLLVDRDRDSHTSLYAVDVINEKFVRMDGKAFAATGVPSDAEWQSFSEWPGLTYIHEYALRHVEEYSY